MVSFPADDLESDIDQYLQVSKDSATQAVGLEALAKIGSLSALTNAVIGSCLQRLAQLIPAPTQSSLYKNTFIRWASHANFDINSIILDGYTIGHVAAKHGNCEAIQALLDVPHYDGNIQDKDGNTALFYACKNLNSEEAIDLIESHIWDLSVINHERQNLHQYYSTLANGHPQLAGYIQKSVKDAAKGTRCHTSL